MQGDYAAHGEMLRRLGAAVVPVRAAADLAGLDALVLPGGESTSMLRLLERDGLWSALADFVAHKPTLGTCAGLILLAVAVEPRQPSLGLLDIAVERNAYGRQLDSRILRSDTELPGGPLEMVFIRAPRIVRTGPAVQVLARYDGDPVLVRQGHILGCAFHPELGRDERVHELLLQQLNQM